MRYVRLSLIVFAWFASAPVAAYAQASITGVVRDPSGAVLPGVTVEATSPVLIEGARVGVTDGTGRYRIEELRPGAYIVTFTLPGFATVRREGIQLTGTFVSTVNAELAVGTVAETITVTGDAPVVDVQSVTRQVVMDREVIDSLPSHQIPARMAALLPGVTASVHDVGGTMGDGGSRGRMVIRGNEDSLISIEGVTNSAHGGSAHGAYNMAAYSEMAVDTGGIGAEQKTGGMRLNLIPRDGGNTFSGSFLASLANSSMQGDNFTQDLQDRGLPAPDSVKEITDINPAFGGPVKRDTLWFFVTARHARAANYVPVLFNKHAGNPDVWIYEPDVSRGPAYNQNTIFNFHGRITWQATPRNKFAFTYEPSGVFDRPRVLDASTAPEANISDYGDLNPKRYVIGSWSAPITNRLLVETTFLKHWSFITRPRDNPYFPPGPVKMIRVTEQSTGLAYRGTAESQDTLGIKYEGRAVTSYVTGSHALKAGFLWGSGDQKRERYSIDSPMEFRFNNGVPNRLTLRAPDGIKTVVDLDADLGLFVQDRWTVGRLTLTPGLRYDYFHMSSPETLVGPAQFAPTRNIRFPAVDNVRWHDIEPRVAVAVDVFGDGKTALKGSVGKYLVDVGARGAFGDEQSPAFLLVRNTNRSWTDANRDFVPNCDLLNPSANGECGAMDNPRFGTTSTGVTYDPDLLRGWGKRTDNWQITAGLQRELTPRVSLDVSYWRSSFGNLIVTDDRAIGPSDFDAFSITAPIDSRLPGGGGYAIGGLYDIRPARFGAPTDGFVTLADNYGKQIDYWNGVDVTVNARPGPGLLLQGGTSTQRRVTDNCEVVARLDNPSPLYCRQPRNFRTEIKLLGSATVPRIDVQVSGTFQSIPGPAIAANYVAANAEVLPSLGRNLAGGARNVTVNLVEPGTMYGERMNQIDLRVGKNLRFGRARLTASVDVYNVFNSNAVLTQNNAFANWQQPQSILNARFAKVVMQLEF